MPHGPVHSWVGGVGGGNAEDVYNNMLDEGLITDAQARQLKVTNQGHEEGTVGVSPLVTYQLMAWVRVRLSLEDYVFPIKCSRTPCMLLFSERLVS